jgi:hypothetical protein
LIANAHKRIDYSPLQTKRHKLAGAALSRYATDPAAFIDQCIIIDDAQDHGDGVGTMPFKLWAAQAELLQAMETEPRLLILKARQLGISWLCCAYALHQSLHKAQHLTLNFSIGQEEANEMMRRITSCTGA